MSSTANSGPPTIFDVLQSIVKNPERTSVPHNGHFTVQATPSPSLVNRTELVKGRIVFGNFVNPNTKTAEQLAAQEATAAEAQLRRQQLGHNNSRRHDDDDTSSRRIEREVMGRQQRLAKEKRESRRPNKH